MHLARSLNPAGHHVMMPMMIMMMMVHYVAEDVSTDLQSAFPWWEWAPGAEGGLQANPAPLGAPQKADCSAAVPQAWQPRSSRQSPPVALPPIAGITCLISTKQLYRSQLRGWRVEGGFASGMVQTCLLQPGLDHNLGDRVFAARLVGSFAIRVKLVLYGVDQLVHSQRTVVNDLDRIIRHVRGELQCNRLPVRPKIACVAESVFRCRLG